MWIGSRTSTRAGRSGGGDETASWWGRDGAVVAVAGSPTHAAALATTLPEGAERSGDSLQAAERRQRPLFVITYLLYTAMLPSVPRWRLVSSAVSGRASEREEISFGT
jgi:hypothetical protein